jgi:hypothetical protein
LGRGDTVVARAEIDLVEIELEDALLGVGLLDAEGEDGLADLARQGRLVGEQEVLGDLLGQPRRALWPLAGIGDVGNHGTYHADEIDAGMGEEALVLGRDEGFQHALGHGGDRHEHPLLAGIFGEQPAIGGIEARGDRRLVVGELLVIGQTVAEVPEQACHRASANDQGGRCKGQQDFEEVQHFHFLYAANPRGSNGEPERKLRLSCGNSGTEVRIDRSSQRPCQCNLVLAHRQELLVLGVRQIAEFDQGGRDVG